MITSYGRGHKLVYNNGWLYLDTMEKFDDSRPCKKCGKMPTKEGYDACLGYIPGAKFACCGHGVEERSIIYND